MSRSFERFFAEYDPLLAVQTIDEVKKILFKSKFCSNTKEIELTVEVGLLQKVEKLASKLFGKSFNREKEFLTGTYKAETIIGESPARNNAMNVGMKTQILPPGVEN